MWGAFFFASFASLLRLPLFPTIPTPADFGLERCQRHLALERRLSRERKKLSRQLNQYFVVLAQLEFG
jgi:hypothetical protein